MELINRIRKSRKGFTLVEIIVVLVILAVLAAFTIPTMLGFVQDARNKANIAVARQVYVAAQAAAVEKYHGSPGITAAALSTNLTGTATATVAEVPNASMKTMLAGDALPNGASWVTVAAEDGAGLATGKITSVAVTIGTKLITITAGEAAVITDK